ncbi:ROK family transcriptional regulator [Neobacillus sp. PS2-9]|uniref:ROK family transcriptional regulator n=1 Tax=Neobacillus sp. PS2-9 TaxID=3070676 RepID=UPI0027E1C6F5|nr:ROK family transcriptional regulator [Neobacillus sp. PS2-9]WML58635.1 ROK family transcriptional regulator [Neobacillus sp. PS2-9]
MSKTGNLDLIKRLNRSLVLETIRNEQPISRAIVAKKLGLSRSTVTLMVNDLLAKKFVIELGLGDSIGGGRKGIELGFNPKSGFGVGVDIGRTKILVVITDLDGEIVYRKGFDSTNSIDGIIQLIKGCIEKSNVDINRILGLGFGLPGIVNSLTGEIIEVPLLNWGQFNFIERIKPFFPFPVFINNDVNCAALGERWLGGKEKIDDMFFIAIGSGVGSAIIAKGNLIEGHGFSAGEINHYIDREDVKKGRAGSRNGVGVFEQQVSGPALSELGYPPSELFSEYKRGNEEVKPIVENFILHLGTAISNAVTLLNPQKVVIGGGVSQSLDVVIEQIRDWVCKLIPIPTEVELACLGSDAGALGAVANVFAKLQDSEIFYD